MHDALIPITFQYFHSEEGIAIEIHSCPKWQEPPVGAQQKRRIHFLAQFLDSFGIHSKMLSHQMCVLAAFQWERLLLKEAKKYLDCCERSSYLKGAERVSVRQPSNHSAVAS